MKYLYLIFLFILASCSNTLSNEDLQQLNGYWEIESVETPSKKTRQYKANTTIDYFYLDKNLNGFRKKLIANFTGKYTGNNYQENIHISQVKEETTTIISKTNQDTWEETIISLTSDKLVLKNSDNITYHYKRHEKINIQ